MSGYLPTRLDYFKEEGNTHFSPIIWGESGLAGLYKTVNDCYSFFRKIAIMVYMVMLVYMGVRILLASTGQNMSRYKTLFMYWVVGVAILFLYPFVMKYAIKLNDSFVEIIATNRTVDGKDYRKIAPQRNSLKDIGGEIQDLEFEANPFTEGGKDYMSLIANDANESGKLAIAIVYLILTWQLTTLLIHYYKRVFMVGFLIAIFPLVAMFYAIDKIGDGKSQAFEQWNKEFILNVFIQSFHAIVYVFVCGTIYAAYSADTGIDYIIIIMGSTFLFTGESIIKQVFSQSSPAGTVKGLGDTAAGAMAKVAIAKNVAKAVTKPIIGKDSIAAKTKNAFDQRKATKAKLDAFDSMATPVQEPNAGLRLDHTQATLDAIDNDPNLTAEQKVQKKEEAIKLANAVATINNPNSRSVEELQRAYSTVQDAMASGENSAILQDLKLTPDQMAAAAGIGAELAREMSINGGNLDPVTVESLIQVRLGIEGMSDQERDKYTNMVLLDLVKNGGSRYGTDVKAGVEAEIDAGVEAIRRITDSFVSRERIDRELEEAEALADDEAVARLEAMRADVDRRRAAINQQARVIADSFHDGEEGAGDRHERAVARSMLILKSGDQGLYTTEEYLDAVTQLQRSMDHNDATRQMAAKLDIDIDLLNHALIYKADEEGKINSKTRDHAREYEKHSRDGLFEDELSGHDLVKLAMQRDPAKRQQLRDEMVETLTAARQKASDYERSQISDIAQEILVSNMVDVDEGGFSGTRYLAGQTREDIEAELKRAKRNIWKSLGGQGEATGFGEFSQEYLDDMKAYNAHFRGDQEGDYTFGKYD